MRCASHQLKILILILLGFAFSSQIALADPVWHCSRSAIQIADTSDDFTLASLSFEREIIRLSLSDLFSVYQGVYVRLNGGLPLSACVISDNGSNLNKAAMQSIRAPSMALSSLLSRNADMKSTIHTVHSESAMLACITQHHPAVGYLSKTTHTEAVGPCF